MIEKNHIKGENKKMKLNSKASKMRKTNKISKANYFNQKGITLIALVITILFSYDEMIKFSNSKGFLLATIQ